jgi:ribosomal protein S9
MDPFLEITAYHGTEKSEKQPQIQRRKRGGGIEGIGESIREGIAKGIAKGIAEEG